MTTNTKEEETKLTYDDRRKILHQKKSQVAENVKDAVTDGEGKVTEKEQLISTVSQSMDVDYTEAGIRLAYKNLVESKTHLTNRVAELKEKCKDVGEMPKELIKLQEQIADIAKFRGSEQARIELKALEEELKDTSKELKQLTDEIGTRLKL